MKKLYLGIELGSTNIKSVLINEKKEIISNGIYPWENKLENGYWTYSIKEAVSGVQKAYSLMRDEYETKYNKNLDYIDAIGISGMMHGYLCFDEGKNQLLEFRTWRNLYTTKASKELTEILQYNVPERYSISHLYESCLNGEKHIDKIKYMTTLSGYIHWLLTGEFVLGINDASGMFPIDKVDYSKEKLCIVNNKIKNLGYNIKVEDIFPKVLVAGENAGTLTKDGAKILDNKGHLKMGIRFCPPEGDIGTTMVCTNTIKENTGSISAGTSIFAMITLKNQLKTLIKEIEVVKSPVGRDTALIHCNNCSGDINGWVFMLKSFLELFNLKVDDKEMYKKLFESIYNSDDNFGNLITVNYLSGEHLTNVAHGHPLLLRNGDSNFNIQNLMRSLITSMFTTLMVGMKKLKEVEDIKLESMVAQGGIFRGVAEEVLSNCLNTQVDTFVHASSGGPYGIALLAAFLDEKEKYSTLDEFLDNEVLWEINSYFPSDNKVKENEKYLEKFLSVIELEKNM